MAAATRSLRWLALAVAARAARHHHATPRFADADAVVRPAAGGSGPTPSFFFVLGVEGTGHHFWTELGAKLNGGELDRLPEEARRRVDGVLTEVTSCFFSLSQPRTPRPCPGCEARQICAFRWRADPWPKFAKIKVEEDGRQEFWYDCRVCGQSYHGPVQIAMAWEVWREYRGRPDGDRCKALAVNTLAQGAFAAGDFALALRFFLAHIAIGRLYFSDCVLDCAVKHFPEVSGCLQALGERAAALALDQLTLTCCTAAFGPEDIRALLCARNVAVSLSRHGEHHGAIALLREKIPVCARAFGDDHETTMTFRSVLCKALLAGDRIAAAVKADARGGRLGDLVLEIAEAAVLAERAVAFSTRFYGVAHPTTNNRRQDLAVARQEIEKFGMKEKLAELGAEGLRARLCAEIDAAGPG